MARCVDAYQEEWGSNAFLGFSSGVRVGSVFGPSPSTTESSISGYGQATVAGSERQPDIFV